MNYIICGIFTIAILFTSIQPVKSQISLDCYGRDMHSIYISSGSGYYRMDSVDTNPTNPILLYPNYGGSGNGISINNDLNNGFPLTVYISKSTLYYRWNGSIFTSAGATLGCINSGGTGNYIYSVDDAGNNLYRFNGTNNTLLLSNIGATPDFVHDIATDSQENFYLYYLNTQKIVVYTSAGIPVDSFTTTGYTGGGAAGMAILGDRIYVSDIHQLYEGIKTGNNINFSFIKYISIDVRDIATCPTATIPLAVFKDPNQPHFAILPNPVNDATMISLVNSVKLEIYDSMGLLKISIVTRGLSEYLLDVSNWQPGIYMINAVSESKTAVRGKLVVN